MLNNSLDYGEKNPPRNTAMSVKTVLLYHLIFLESGREANILHIN